MKTIRPFISLLALLTGSAFAQSEPVQAIFQAEDLTLNNRAEIVELDGAAGGKVVQVKEGQTIGTVTALFNGEGSATVRLHCIDSIGGSGTVKLYRNKKMVKTWTLTKDDNQMTIVEWQLDLSVGDEIMVKLFGNEKLDQIEVIL